MLLKNILLKSNYDNIAHLYDELQHFSHEKEYLNNLLAFLNKKIIKTNGLDILDLACGTGSFLSTIEKNNNCYGLDNSFKMLEIADTKLTQTKLFHQDYRNFKFQKKFDLITCLSDSMNHTLDIELVLASVKEHLKNKGFFIFDYYTSYGLDKCSSIENNNFSVKKIHGIYKWEVKSKNVYSIVKEYVLKIEDFLKPITSCFKVEIYNQSFVLLENDNIKDDVFINENRIEKFVIVAKLK